MSRYQTLVALVFGVLVANGLRSMPPFLEQALEPQQRASIEEELLLEAQSEFAEGLELREGGGFREQREE